MKKSIFLIFGFIFAFCLGLLTNIFLIQINKSKEPFTLKWFYNDEGNIDGYTLGDRNGLMIMGSYNPDGLETLNIYDEKKEYHQFTVFGKSYNGSVDSSEPPKANEIIEIDSFLTRTETINNAEIKYYIDNSKNPKIIMADK
ncbi:hypothetical protein [Treponema sp. Marseille-Q4130]|uniref:hypothetical protein n=1 Tax=Treponema sp. Marseille-Q4130 TaxID=2766702 RepID=UPI001652A378|nr:hypothetical protein [Treponema sp. Marseille-Q4130]MBC6719226.1 hypothetical protein [Treponema sp. Marseille-Q4130]